MNAPDSLTTLFSHNRWANLRLLDRCAELTNEHLEATVSGTFGSIRETLHHIVTSEASYLHRIRTGQPYPDSDDERPMTIAEMITFAQASGAGLIEWAPLVSAEEEVTVTWLDGSRRQVPKAIFLTQVINHATEHRAQITAILTQLGVEPPSLDAWTFFAERA